MKSSFIYAAIMCCVCFVLPISSYAAGQSTLDVTDEIKTITTAENLDITISGKGELHITSRNPMINSRVDLRGDDAMLCLEGVLPSEAGSYSPYVSVGGLPFDRAAARIAIYGSGCAIVAGADVPPLTIYMEKDFGGKSMQCVPDIYYRADERAGKKKWLPEKGLGEFDNHIRSFRLRHGYQATFANDPTGSGHSRVFIAANGDLEIPAMPQGLEFASFIRVCRLDWVGKKGVCSSSHVDLARATWYYDWGGGSESTVNGEYVPMRHNAYWDSWENIGTRTDVSCVLGFNEPDHSDQSNLSVAGTMQMWPELLKNGLRVGSPAPDQISKDWLKQFIAYADSLNFRVDFVATHMYWNSQNADGLVRNIESLCKQYYGGRPMWITEWNNGANWTNEPWPDRTGPRLDANFKPLLDENGVQQQTTRPHTEANSQVQCKWLASMLRAFDESRYIERHSLFNWVEDARSIIIANSDGVEELTPAGKIFADFQSRPALSGGVEYIHEWKIAPPMIKASRSSNKLKVQLYDHNGETGTGYIVERKIDDGPWEQIATLLPGKDYSYGSYKTFSDTVEYNGLYSYRMKATSYIGTESGYSRISTFNVTNLASGVCEAVSGNSVPRFSTAGGQLHVKGLAPGRYHLVSVDGRTLRVIDVDSCGSATVDGLSAGVYIIAGHKVIL